MCSIRLGPAIGSLRTCRRYRERVRHCSFPSSTGSLWLCGRTGGDLGVPASPVKAVRRTAALAAAAVLACWSAAAWAYRPFDGTDAAVAEKGEMEVELGPVEYRREGAEHIMFAPDVRVNYGFT